MSSLSPASPPSHKNTTKPLPPGWKWVKLGEVTNVVNGTTPASENKLYWNGDIVWITPTDLGKLDLPEITNSERRITSAGFKNSNLTLVPPGTVVLSSRAPIGHLGIATIELCTNQGCKSFIPGSEIDTYYLYFTLKKSVPKLKEIGRGPTFDEISKSQCERFDIPMPLLSEQKRIAAILKEQLAAVDKARKAAEERLEAVKALPAAFLRKVFPRPGQPLPEGWKWVKLGEVCEFINGRAYSANELLESGKYPILRVGNLFTSDHWYYSNLELESEKYCEEGDLVYAWSASFGPFIWKGPKVIYHYHIWKVLCRERIIPDYTCFALEIITERIKKNSHGIAMLHMTKEKIEKFEIPFPPIPEQKSISSHLKKQMASFDKALKVAEEELKTINALPAAILRKAFNGEL